MNKWSKPILLGSFVFIAACVTINVYFPAAEVESAAKEFVEDVLREEPQANQDDQTSVINVSNVYRLAAIANPLNWFISSAHAQADINLSSPAIASLKAKMIDRMNASLRSHLENNVVGFTNNGLVEIIDASQLSLKDRQTVKKVVADENRDRNALYREVAIANNQPEWEDQIRGAWVKQWIAQAKSGWLYQNAANEWVTK